MTVPTLRVMTHVAHHMYACQMDLAILPVQLCSWIQQYTLYPWKGQACNFSGTLDLTAPHMFFTSLTLMEVELT